MQIVYTRCVYKNRSCYQW